MKLTATQLKKIIAEEVAKATGVTEAAAPTAFRMTDAVSGDTVMVGVVEGNEPYTVTLRFGSSFSINLQLEDARSLGQALLDAGQEY